MTQVTIEIDKVPEGYKAVAFRHVKQGEWYLSPGGRAAQWKLDTSAERYLILKPALRLQSGKFYVDEDGQVVGVKWANSKEVYVGDDGRREFHAFGEPATRHKPLVREATKIEALQHLAEIHGLGEIELGPVALGQEFRIRLELADRTLVIDKGMLKGVSPDTLTFSQTGGYMSW